MSWGLEWMLARRSVKRERDGKFWVVNEDLDAGVGMDVNSDVKAVR